MTIRLGIDFGTTRIVVAAQENGNYPVCTFSWQGESKEYIPTLVGVKDGILHFGWDAACLLNRPDAFILRSLKRLAGHLRPEDPVHLEPGFSIPLLEVVTLFLNHVRQMILKHGNISLKKNDAIMVMVAAPANAGSHQRHITLEGFRRAGFTILGAMNEPSAIAVEFLHRNLRDLRPRSQKRYIAVYDLGGSTFEASVARIADRSYDVLAHEGIAKLGGDDFDEIILNLALEQIGLAQETFTPNDRVRLLEECRERKEGLKSNTKKMVVDLGTVLRDQEPVILDTELVYERCDPLIERSVKTLQSLLEGIDQKPEQSRSLAAVYLVGGSVSFPPVARKLREIYPDKVRISPLPHASTAIGLSIAGDPKSNIKVRESVSRRFGVGVEAEIRKRGRIKKRRIRWHPSPSAEVSHYRLYWSVGKAVGYDSHHVELGDVTEAILPDDILSFPLISGTVHLGITALTNAGNESDMTRISAAFDFLVPEIRKRIWLKK